MFLVGSISLRGNIMLSANFATRKAAVNNFYEFRVYFLTNIGITYHSRIDLIITKWLLNLSGFFFHLLLVAIGY